MADAVRAAEGGSGDVVDFLVGQHEEIKDLMSLVLNATGEERQALWDRTRALLARHEAAEEAVLRPLTRSAPDGAAVAEARVAEEHRADEMLTFLDRFEVGSIAFDTQFRELQEEVLRHAENEETQEFPLLRQTLDAAALQRARAAVERTESAPAHAPAARTGSVLRSLAARLFRS